MRTIGLLGGMSYHSTIDYYVGINRAVAAARGGHHSAPLLLSSVDFADLRGYQEAGDWTGAGDYLAHHAWALQSAGAQAVLICSNLMHKVAPQVEAAIDVPLLHIVDAVAARARREGLASLGIMGARWTMTEPFYADRLAAAGISPVRADDADVAATDGVIWGELTRGVVSERSRLRLQRVVSGLGEAGAEGVLLGCTELPLLLGADTSPLPVIDSTAAHVEAAAGFVLGGEPRPLASAGQRPDGASVR